MIHCIDWIMYWLTRPLILNTTIQNVQGSRNNWRISRKLDQLEFLVSHRGGVLDKPFIHLLDCLCALHYILLSTTDGWMRHTYSGTGFGIEHLFLQRSLSNNTRILLFYDRLLNVSLEYLLHFQGRVRGLLQKSHVIKSRSVSNLLFLMNREI